LQEGPPHLSLIMSLKRRSEDGEGWRADGYYDSVVLVDAMTR
jgi:hypothetical protein